MTRSREQVLVDLEEAVREVPILDPHSHIVVSRPGAQDLSDVLLYHMVVSDLYSAGCPSGNRLTEFPGTPSREESRSRVVEALPYLGRIRNTSSAWALRIALDELYGWDGPVTVDNWEMLDATIRERSGDPRWSADVLDRARIERVTTEYARRADGDAHQRYVYALEWAFFTRTQWHEFDTALYELERCWGRSPASPTPIGSDRQDATLQRITSLGDVHAAIESYVSAIPFDQVNAVTSHFSTAIDYRQVSDSEMEQALNNRGNAGTLERDVYASYVMENFLQKLSDLGRDTLVQLSIGAEPLPYETGSHLPQDAILAFGDMVSRYPSLRFQCFIAARHANQAFCTLARELPNLSLAGYWWHNFFPEAIRQVMAERLDMLPLNKQIGFFSDAYCVEWSYAKAAVVRRQMAQVLADRIHQRQYTWDEALDIARSILWESPQVINRIAPMADIPDLPERDEVWQEIPTTGSVQEP